MTDTQALTHNQIDEMSAGREMYQLIAEMVMGLDGNQVMWTAGIPPRPCYPHYSTNIADAWKVVEEVNAIAKEKEDVDGIYQLQLIKWGDNWNAVFDFIAPDVSDAWYEVELSEWGNDERRCARAETASLAICRAALKAILEK